jgi:hypothetical protein
MEVRQTPGNVVWPAPGVRPGFIAAVEQKPRLTRRILPVIPGISGFSTVRIAYAIWNKVYPDRTRER